MKSRIPPEPGFEGNSDSGRTGPSGEDADSLLLTTNGNMPLSTPFPYTNIGKGGIVGAAPTTNSSPTIIPPTTPSPAGG